MTNHVTQAAMVDRLGRLGIRPTSHIMVHASLSRFGHVEGGAETVIAALREATSPAGGVIMPSFRDAIRSDNYALSLCLTQCPQRLCTSGQRGFTGKIGETLREQSDCLRSCHPTHSWVGVGGDAEFLLEGHRHSPTPCGHDSPFFRLMERDGKLLLLGVGVNSLTNIHAVEDVRNVPYLSAIDPARRHATYTTSGRRIQYCFPELLFQTLVAAGLVRTMRIGQATCHAMSARDLGSFLWTVTEDDPWCLVLRPMKETYDPQQDAVEKTQRMLQCWQGRRDRDPWELFLQASREPVNPVLFQEASEPRTECPAYRGRIREHHRCAANDPPPWESFEQFDDWTDEPGVVTCGQCNWPEFNTP